MRKFWEYLQRSLFILSYFVGLCVCWTATYYLLPLLFQSIGVTPFPLIQQLLNSLLGLAFFILIIWFIMRSYQLRQFDFFQLLMDALRQIAHGDFDVHIQVKWLGRMNHPFIQLANNINEMAAKLGEIEQLRQEFISNVSHEIRSPLTSISGFASALKQGTLSAEEQKHYLDIIEQESERLVNLSDSLLKLSTLQAESYRIAHDTYRLDQQLRHVVLAHEPQWMEKQLDIELELQEVEIEADRELLQQVWQNLLHNSIKFTPAGGCIRLLLTSRGKKVQVCVEDTGIGLSEVDQIRVFERFYKADPSRHRGVGGSGLGLAIVKQIVDLHSGEIDLQSEVGKGTKVCINLPQRIVKRSG